MLDGDFGFRMVTSGGGEQRVVWFRQLRSEDDVTIERKTETEGKIRVLSLARPGSDTSLPVTDVPVWLKPGKAARWTEENGVSVRRPPTRDRWMITDAGWERIRQQLGKAMGVAFQQGRFQRGSAP
ncbi:hypothetical protein HQ576_12790 [bacterium]|nr:hypothetical protein [bacterium]